MRRAVAVGFVVSVLGAVAAFGGCSEYSDTQGHGEGPPDANTSTNDPDDSGANGDGQTSRPTPLQAAPEPTAPSFPGTVGTVSVGIRTDITETAGTNSAFEVCFAESMTSPPTQCQRLDIPAVNDFRVGGFDRYHFERLALPRSQAAFVVVRPVGGSGDDALRLSCIDVRFDGEPVACAEGSRLIGSGGAVGELAELRQPLGNSCTSCEARKLVHGPKVGPSGPNKVRVWVRTDATRKVGLYLSDSPDGTGAVPVGWAYPRAEDDFAATIESSSPLDPDRTYYYRVAVDDDASSASTPFRRIRTELPRTASVRVGMGSCARNATQPIYAAIGAAKPDAFLFLGDNHYGNTRDLAAQRFHYRSIDALAGRTAVLAEAHTIATWDDHDYVENNSDGLCAGRADALRAFKEAWPNAAFGTSTTPGAFSSQRVGPVDVLMLDCRSYRPRVADPGRACDRDAGVPAGQDLRGGPIGEVQYQWLMSELARSDAPFKLVTCGSLFTSPGIDSWASFPEARERLFGELASRKISGVVFASGDIHRSEFRKTERAGTYPLYELVSSPMARDEANGCANEPDPKRIACYDVGNSFVTVDVDGAAPVPTLTARILDEGGVERAKLTLPRSELE